MAQIHPHPTVVGDLVAESGPRPAALRSGLARCHSRRTRRNPGRDPRRGRDRDPVCGRGVARFVLHAPLIWSDELASILFLWLAMLGAVVAFRRGEHMRMTAVVGVLAARCGVSRCRSRPRRRSRSCADRLAGLRICARRGFITTPALESPMPGVRPPCRSASVSWRSSPCFACSGGVARRVVLAWRSWWPSSLPLWLAQPALRQLGNLNLLIFFVGVVAAVSAGARSPSLRPCGPSATSPLTTQTPTAGPRRAHGRGHVAPHPAVRAAFRLSRTPIEMTGMARAMVAFLASSAWARPGRSPLRARRRHVPLVSGISGSKAADMAAVAPSCSRRCSERGAKPGTSWPCSPRQEPRPRPFRQHRPDHHRLGHGGVDRGPLHRRPAARRGARVTLCSWSGGATGSEDLSHVKRATNRRSAAPS